MFALLIGVFPYSCEIKEIFGIILKNRVVKRLLLWFQGNFSKTLIPRDGQNNLQKVLVVYGHTLLKKGIQVTERSISFTWSYRGSLQVWPSFYYTINLNLLKLTQCCCLFVVFFQCVAFVSMPMQLSMWLHVFEGEKNLIIICSFLEF